MRWRKLSLDGRWRRGIILGLGLLAVVSGYVAFQAFRTPLRATSPVPVWRWAHWGQWDYTVALKPNSIYPTLELGPDLTYYQALVQGIQARFFYGFRADAPVRIEGWYQVTALLEAESLPAEAYVVIPKTPFLQADSSARFTLEVEVPAQRELFQKRLEELAAATGLRSPAKPTVTYMAHVEATASDSAGSTAAEVLKPTLAIPLSGETFTITGDRSKSQNGAIRRPQEVAVPGLAQRRAYSLGAAGLLGLLAVAFALLTRPRPGQADPVAREARRLCRHYRKRLAVAGSGQADVLGGQVVSLASMADLARVSDELLKPIIYAAPTPAGGPHLFFIVDGAICYQYRLG